jgi:heme-degrading monooxygenase HmoA
MYAVIFKAEINEFDELYSSTATRMRELAIKEYGCKEFTSCCEGDFEIAISYWESKEQIIAWKNNPEHLKAQSLGKAKWYKNYQVQVVEVLREYGAST